MDKNLTNLYIHLNQRKDTIRASLIFINLYTADENSGGERVRQIVGSEQDYSI